MNWDAVGAVGEIASAIAVIVTLVYLARQVSDAKKAIRRQSIQDAGANFNQIYHIIAGSPELAEALGKLQKGEALTRGQSVQIQAHAIAQFNALESTYMQSLEAKDYVAIEDIGEWIEVAFKYPGMRENWNEFKVLTRSPFRDFVHSKLGI